MADNKSLVSFGDTFSYGDSTSLSGTSKGSRSESRRSRHMAKMKRRNENQPTRKLLFRPRVYESWKEGDLDFESAERERLIKDIAAKEQRLQEKRRKRLDEGGDAENEDSDSSGENQVVKALERLKSRKQREEEYRKKLEDDKHRMEEEAQMEMEEKLASELQNPSVYGWFYTDGYYDNAPFFGVREDLVPKLAEEQEAWRDKWAQKYPETFTSMFRRFFWPPKYICKGRSFRTRGSYLDFPEVIADWPKEVDVNFEREPREYITNRHELFGVDEEQKKEDEQALEEALAEAEAENEGEGDPNALKGKGDFQKQFIDLSLDSDKLDSNAWYYDDDEGQFYKKKLGFDIEYYYDNMNHCWRHKKKRGKYKSENQQTPFDYYFDDAIAEFLPREDFQGLDELVYDHKTGVFRIHQISKKPTKKNKSGKTIIEFPEFKGDTEFEYNEDGEPVGVVGGSKRKYKPQSYYFDEELGKWVLRHELPEGVNSTDITWDENGKRYTRKFEGVWRGLTGYSPDDYYWSDRTRKFTPKPPRQSDNFKYYSLDGLWRKNDEVTASTSLRSEDASRFYFDDFEGQFKPKDLTKGGGSRYIQGRFTKIWRKVPKPKSNMYPDEFYWDTYKKRWLPRTIRMEMLKNAEVARQKNIMEGQKSGLGNVWDIKQNDKDTQPEDFYFDTEEGVFLKKRPQDEYIFDEAEGCFKLVSMKERPRQSRFLHEYYFEGDGKFYLKEPGGNYTYDQTFHCWKKIGPPVDLSTVDPPPNKYFYDLNAEVFTPKGSESLRYDHNMMWDVIPSSDPNFKCPDDFYFHEGEGRFYPKETDQAKAGNYVYDQTLGAWTHKDIKGPNQSGLTPRNFYWDDLTKMFKLKVASREKADYFYDANNKIFRHILSSGRTKSGLRPSDFTWNYEFRAYIPMAFLKKGRVIVTDDLPKWEPMRRYDKPWASSETSLKNPDSATEDAIDTKSKSGKPKKFRNNKVSPMPEEGSESLDEMEAKSSRTKAQSTKKQKWKK